MVIETLVARSQAPADEDYIARNKTAVSISAHSPFSLVRDPQVFSVLLNYGVLAFCSLSLSVVLPIYSLLSIEKGGLGFSIADVGNALAGRSISILLLSFFVFPLLQQSWGTISTFLRQYVGSLDSLVLSGSYRILINFFPLSIIIFAYANVLRNYLGVTSSFALAIAFSACVDNLTHILG